MNFLAKVVFRCQKILKNIRNPKKFKTIDLLEKTNNQSIIIQCVINDNMEVCVGPNVLCM